MQTIDKAILIILGGIVSLLASLPTVGKNNLTLWTYGLLGLIFLLLGALLVKITLSDHPWFKKEHELPF